MEPHVLADISTCLSCLGGAFLQDPKKEESRAYYEALKQVAEERDWPFGCEDELDASFSEIKEGLLHDRDRLKKEYQRLFVGPEHFVAPPWGSIYLDKENVLFGPSLFALRQWMRQNNIETNTNANEPEDYIGTELMLGAFLAAQKPELLEEYLSEFLMLWALRYFELLEGDARQPFYRGIAKLATTTMKGISEGVDIKPRSKKLYF